MNNRYTNIKNVQLVGKDKVKSQINLIQKVRTWFVVRINVTGVRLKCN